MKKLLSLFILMLSPMLANAADVKINEMTFPDSNFRNWVLSQDYGADGVLTNEELENVISINISRLEIHELKGIEYFTALKDLNCMTNKLTTLDLSKNTALEKLECRGNRLTTINLLGNRQLRSLKCGGTSYGNQLTSLDLSNCTELDTLACSGNPLTALDVSKNTKLTYLGCYSNQLTALDLSKNTALNYLQCNNNQLTALDVSKNTALTFLQCSSNLLTTLDVTKNSALTDLSCTDNKLTTLSVSNNKSVESIICSDNQLASLDVSGCSALNSLGCDNNQLSILNLSGCSALISLSCDNNQLTTLDLSENSALTDMYCYQNNIKGIGMDALVESLPIVSEGSLCVMYFEKEQNVMTTTQVAAAKAKGWTPYIFEYYYKMEEYAGSETVQDDHQDTTYYYYYKGNKIPLTLNENKVVVSIPKEYDGVCKRIRANLPVLSTIKDEVFDSYIIPRSDFEKLTSKDFWEEDTKSVVLTSSYYTEDKTEVFETPYLNVRLKKEEDADLLASYAEKYRLKIVGNDSFMPLWYILHVTPESEKSPLKCANLLFESGEFASAVPDLSSDDDFEIGVAYRPFVEDGKVWKVGTISGNPVQVVDYYYFDGDTIIGGKNCKQMMCQRCVAPDFSNDYWTPTPSLTKVGAWYEEDKKVYFYDERKQSVMLKYDFTIWDNGSVQLIDDYPPFIIGPKQTGGLEGFKGVYRDVMINQDVRSTTWLEGVGGIDGPTRNVYPEAADHLPEFLMSCTVGDEVIYLNDAYEDGATPEGARKDRIDFTHTIKIRPKTRMMEETEAKSLYGEYNNQQLGIHLNALDDAYQVSITDEAGKVVYEKTVNAGSIVGLNIDISAYVKGRYTVTVENSDESFTGMFETQTTGIEENVRIEKLKNGSIYNLQGQRINALRKGLNIVNGRKVYKY